MRAKTFDRAAVARAERLSAKLKDLIAQPKAKDPEIMDVEQTEDADSAESKPEDALITEGMLEEEQVTR